MDSQHRIEADDASRHAVDRTGEAFRPWTAADIRWLARNLRWPTVVLDGQVLDDEKSWRAALETATFEQLAALHRSLGADDPHDDLEPDNDLEPDEALEPGEDLEA